MAGEFSYYCPYLGKRVIVKSEADLKNVQCFSNGYHKGICQINKGVCNGKCMIVG